MSNLILLKISKESYKIWLNESSDFVEGKFKSDGIDGIALNTAVSNFINNHFIEAEQKIKIHYWLTPEVANFDLYSAIRVPANQKYIIGEKINLNTYLTKKAATLHCQSFSNNTLNLKLYAPEAPSPTYEDNFNTPDLDPKIKIMSDLIFKDIQISNHFYLPGSESSFKEAIVDYLDSNKEEVLNNAGGSLSIHQKNYNFHIIPENIRISIEKYTDASNALLAAVERICSENGFDYKNTTLLLFGKEITSDTFIQKLRDHFNNIIIPDAPEGERQIVTNFFQKSRQNIPTTRNVPTDTQASPPPQPPHPPQSLHSLQNELLQALKATQYGFAKPIALDEMNKLISFSIPMAKATSAKLLFQSIEGGLKVQFDLGDAVLANRVQTASPELGNSTYGLAFRSDPSFQKEDAVDSAVRLLNKVQVELNRLQPTTTKPPTIPTTDQSKKKSPSTLLIPLAAFVIIGLLLWQFRDKLFSKDSTEAVVQDIKSTSEPVATPPSPAAEFQVEYTATRYAQGDGLISGGQSFSTFTIAQHPELGKRIALVSNPGNLGIEAFIANQQKLSGTSEGAPIFPAKADFFAITGAMFYEGDNLPPGLVVINGQIIKPINRALEGKGNFFSPPPNGVIFVSDSEMGIRTTSGVDDTQLSTYRFALQSGPMLVISGNINTGFNPSSPNKHIRCAVGVSERGGVKSLVFAASKAKVSFYELASFMKNDLGCANALHLESINAFMYFPGSDYPVDKQFIKNYLIIR